MNKLGEYPYPCELDAINQAAIDICDPLDGLVDGVITNEESCLSTFDPTELVGTLTYCPETDSKVKISSAAATVVKKLWKGVTTPEGKQLTNPFNPGSDLTGNNHGGYPGIAYTVCSRNNNNNDDNLTSQTDVPGQQWVSPLDAGNPSIGINRCEGAPNALCDQFLRLWVAKDPNFDVSKLTVESFIEMMLEGAREYGPLLDTTDPNLSKFRDAGGKMITIHGAVGYSPETLCAMQLNR